jgi:hypothetical protein
MNNDFAEAGGPVNNVGAREDSNALSIIFLISSSLSIFEKTLIARSLTLNFNVCSGSGISYTCCVLCFLRKLNIEHQHPFIKLIAKPARVYRWSIR